MKHPAGQKTRKKQASLLSKPAVLPSIGKGRKAQRLNQILSLAGLTSRRKADDWIKSGRVSVNGLLVTELGTRADWSYDSIMVDGREIPKPSPRIYLMLNKPFGFVCTLKDPEGRRQVTELLGGITHRVYPVGRLDFDSFGLLLVTNDGEFAYRLTHPKYQVPRTYKVMVEGYITDGTMALLRNGVPLEDGHSGPSKITLISRNEKCSTIRMVITQGRSRQVRRMLEAVGYGVTHLIRTGFGGLRLGDLKVGECRFLEKEELESLKRTVGLV